MSDDNPKLAEALTWEFKYTDKLDDHSEGVYYIEHWELMNLPDEVLPRAETVESPPASWEAPDMEKNTKFQKWHRTTNRRVREQAIEDAQKDRRVAEEERDNIERKLSALDWFEEACMRSAQTWEVRIDKGIRTANRYGDSLEESSPMDESGITLQAMMKMLERQELDSSPKRILHTEIGRAVQAQKRLEITRRLLREISRVRELLTLRLKIYRKAIAHVKAGADPTTFKPKSRKGRLRRLDKPEKVLETLSIVCKWLDTDPPPNFRGNGSLVDFAKDPFVLGEPGTRDRIKETFSRLAKEHPDLPTPELDTGTDGRKYLENEECIRNLRDEYKARFVDK